MKFAVVGTGGVGGFFGGKLAKSGEEVWFLARGKHLDAMRAAGLRVRSTEADYVLPPGRMTDSAAQAGPVDVVLFCVKSYDTESAARSLDPLLKDESIIISLQNGIDNEEKIQREIRRGAVYGGVANIYSTITAPGEITETGGPRKIIFGPLGHSAPDGRGRSILDVMQRAGINATLSDNIHIDLWEKYIFITAVAGITALTRLTLGEILAVPATKSLLADAMKETLAVAHANGVRVTPGFIDNVFTALQRFPNNSRSSLYHDLVYDRPLEIEALSGGVIKLGKEPGIPTPIHQTIYASLLPYHLKNTNQRISD